MSDQIERPVPPDDQENSRNDDTVTDYESLDAVTSEECVLKMGLLNAHSIVDKFRKQKLHGLIKRRDFDILFLVETWETTETSQEVLDELAPRHYSVLRCPRSIYDDEGPQQGGGLAVIHRTAIAVEETHEAIEHVNY